MTKHNLTGGAFTRRNALAVALAVGLGFTGVALGQATSGAIFGNAAAASGETVRVTGSGINRTATVGANGKYSVSNLPVGTYTVTLTDSSGNAISSRSDVTITVGAGTEVDFAAPSSSNATSLGAVQVNANALPSIDVTSVNSAFTVTSQQLEQLPVGRNAESIALLAPGVVAASGYFGNVLSVAGAGATENAYYVNGYNTTNIYNYTGASYQLPYGSIAQQENLMGGFSAKYGRSDGGVLNQIGKRGTNEWHFGGQINWSPRFASADPRDEYYPFVNLRPGESFVSQQVHPGQLRRYRNANKGWTTEYDAYVSGPLIKDKLFFFLSAAQTKSANRNVLGVGSNEDDYYRNRDLRYYGKIDWNINDNNILEFTDLKQVSKNGYGTAYKFNNTTLTDGPALGGLSYLDYHYDTKIFHYTSYISDAATLSVLYGYSDATNPTLVPNESPLPRIVGALNQDPAYTNGNAITNAQTVHVVNSPDAREHSKNLRVDFSYRLGDHLFEAGIDNVHYAASSQGRKYSGPGYIWYYLSGDPNAPINDTLGVGAPGGNGYYVDKVIFNSVTQMSADQKAYYIQDKWQLTPNLLLSLGIRNDEFTNSNANGVKFVDQKNQWEPRLGFSWDVNGDSSLKIYGNVGRYYLALPQAVAERTASGSTFTDQYFTYSGIDSNGIPTGLTPVQGTNGAGPTGPVSANNEFGQAPDPQTVTATNLKAQYQDEYILGFDKTWGPNWTYGAKVTYRKLHTVIDDICDPYKLRDKLTAMGLNASDYKWGAPYCRLSNPGQTNIYKVNKVGGGSINLAMTNADYGTFPQPKREYYGLDLYLEHPFDGVWMGRVDYTFSRAYGNTEGQVRSDFGQTDVSITEDWDYVQLMSGAGGRLLNDRTHQLKAYGAWQVTPDWLISGTLRVQSGTPQECLGLYGPNQTNPGAGYGGGSYHWCNGKVSPPGSLSDTPWTETLDLGVTYRPAFADHKLAFKMNVFNLLNQQRTLQTDPQLRVNDSPTTVSNTYHAGLFYQTPRYVRFSVSYDY